MFLPIIYFFFPETKGRTLEEMGRLFGDKHVAASWYGISQEEKLKIQEEAQRLSDTGTLDGWSDAEHKSRDNSETEYVVKEAAADHSPDSGHDNTETDPGGFPRQPDVEKQDVFGTDGATTHPVTDAERKEEV